MKVSRSAQTCALGSAIFGAVVGGAYRNVHEAQAAMTGVKEKVYEPNPEAVATYAEIFKLYSDLHDGLGLKSASGNLAHVMKDLIVLRDEARRS